MKQKAIIGIACLTIIAVAMIGIPNSWAKAGDIPCTTTINIKRPKIAFADGTNLSPDTFTKTITVIPAK